MKLLQKRVNELIRLHGGIRAAAEATGINHAALIRIRDGDKTDMLEESLALIGLEHIPELEIHRRKKNEAKKTNI